MKKETKSGRLLPENAYRKLESGEEYHPIIPAGDTGTPEVTKWSVTVALIMVVIFTGACVYMALRAGNGIEASIPIAILAIFFGSTRKAKSSILENVMVQSIGQAAGVVAAGASFVVPAMYINQVQPSFWHIFFACAFGGFLGTVLIIPLRKYFVKDKHGELPFPEATAINEIIVSGESGAGGAGKILLMAFALGACYDFLIEGVHLWNPNLNSTVLLGSFGETLSSMRIELSISATAALFGLGYIIGLKYASIIAAGSVLSFLVMVPAIYLVGQNVPSFEYAGQTYQVGRMSVMQIFSAFVKPIGIGAIAISGFFGIMRMWKIVANSVLLGIKSFTHKEETSGEIRTQTDMNPKLVILIQLASVFGLGILFFIVSIFTKNPETGQSMYTSGQAFLYAFMGMVVGFLLSFLFTPVAAEAIAIVGTNPVSGMTLITIVLGIAAMLLVGLSGTAGMFIALIIGTAVCTALSTAGALISDFKIGYWVGSTPKNQEKWKFLGIIVAALTVALVIPLMDSSYQFLVTDPSTGQLISNTKDLPAPQANMLAAVSKGLMTEPANQPWLMYGLGGLVAIMLWMTGIPMLAFALGMYLPIFINFGVLAGALTAWFIKKTGKTEEEQKTLNDQGTLIASGMVAGAAIFGILSAILRVPDFGALIRYISVGEHFQLKGSSLVSQAASWYEHTGQIISLIMYIGLGFISYFLARLGLKWSRK